MTDDLEYKYVKGQGWIPQPTQTNPWDGPNYEWYVDKIWNPLTERYTLSEPYRIDEQGNRIPLRSW